MGNVTVTYFWVPKYPNLFHIVNVIFRHVIWDKSNKTFFLHIVTVTFRLGI